MPGIPFLEVRTDKKFQNPTHKFKIATETTEINKIKYVDYIKCLDKLSKEVTLTTI